MTIVYSGHEVEMTISNWSDMQSLVRYWNLMICERLAAHALIYGEDMAVIGRIAWKPDQTLEVARTTRIYGKSTRVSCRQSIIILIAAPQSMSSVGSRDSHTAFPVPQVRRLASSESGWLGGLDEVIAITAGCQALAEASHTAC